MSAFNNFQDIANTIPSAAAKAVKKAAFDAQRHIQEHIVSNGQVDTGFMMNSVYVVTSEGSSYKNDARSLPEVPPPESPTAAYVAVGAAYAAYQNYGTRFLPPRPFFEPGIEDTRAEIDAALEAIRAAMEQGGH